MSQFSGAQGPGVMRDRREVKRREAVERNRKTPEERRRQTRLLQLEVDLAAQEVQQQKTTRRRVRARRETT